MYRGKSGVNTVLVSNAVFFNDYQRMLIDVINKLEMCDSFEIRMSFFMDIHVLHSELSYTKL
jgi:HKD family nuclease